MSLSRRSAPTVVAPNRRNHIMPKPNRPRSRRFVPALQRLEDRSVPAGNVVAVAFGGTLYILGDGAANQVWVSGTGKHSATIMPLDTTTTINGQSGPASFDGIKNG